MMLFKELIKGACQSEATLPPSVQKNDLHPTFMAHLRCRSGHEESGSRCSLQPFQTLDQRNCQGEEVMELYKYQKEFGIQPIS